MPTPIRPVHHSETNYRQVLDQTDKILRRNVSFGDGSNSDNIFGVWVTVTSPVAPNTQFTVNHSLGQVPVAFDVKRKNAAGDVYDSGTPWTATQIFLKCSAASVTLTLFIH